MWFCFPHVALGTAKAPQQAGYPGRAAAAAVCPPGCPATVLGEACMVVNPDLSNAYLAHKHHLGPGSHGSDVVQMCRDIVALHSTDPTGPYLSLWARGQGFRREQLEHALYEEHTLVRVLCMRVTIHVVAGDELPYFHKAYTGRPEPPDRGEMPDWLLVTAGLCRPADAPALKVELERRVLACVHQKGLATTQEVSHAVPELKAKITHDVGKAYQGQFSIGSRLLRDLCSQGKLIRARPRGTWRSNLFEYAVLSDWLPGVDLEAISCQEAQAWLVRRYLGAFGPATVDDVQWWTGFTKGETMQALDALGRQVVETELAGYNAPFLMLVEDTQGLASFNPSGAPWACMLPALDPLIMGYQDRSRLLDSAHRKKLFDRAGNAVPTAWANGRVVGAWGQRGDGTVVLGLLEPVSEVMRALLDAEARRLEAFLDGEVLRPRSGTAFTRSLVAGV